MAPQVGVDESSIEIDGPVEQLLVLFSKCLIPMIWFGNHLDHFLTRLAPVDWCEIEAFIQVKNIFVSICTIALASTVAAIVFPIVLLIVFCTFPLWMTLLCILFIRFFLTKRKLK